MGESARSWVSPPQPSVPQSLPCMRLVGVTSRVLSAVPLSQLSCRTLESLVKTFRPTSLLCVPDPAGQHRRGGFYLMGKGHQAVQGSSDTVTPSGLPAPQRVPRGLRRRCRRHLLSPREQLSGTSFCFCSRKALSVRHRLLCLSRARCPPRNCRGLSCGDRQTQEPLGKVRSEVRRVTPGHTEASGAGAWVPSSPCSRSAVTAAIWLPPQTALRLSLCSATSP